MSNPTPAPPDSGIDSTAVDPQPVSPIDEQTQRISHDGSSASSAQRYRPSNTSTTPVDADQHLSNGNAAAPAATSPVAHQTQQLPATSPQQPPAPTSPTRTPWKSSWTAAMLWKGELIAAVAALLLVAIEVILFAHYDDKFMFSNHFGLNYTATWPFSFKINALFAFLTSLIEAAVSFYLASCIGQLRWHFYMKKAHRMGWLDIMTDARGPPGALRLIFKRGTHR
jgi:hypothetical protein